MGISADLIRKAITSSFGQDVKFLLEDTVGDEDHYSLTMPSSIFLGMSRVERHRAVYAALEKGLEIMPHAIQINFN